MKVLLDTDVVLDVLLEREPFVAHSAALLARVERGELTAVVDATTVTTIHYLATRVVGSEAARSAVGDMLSILQVAAVNQPVIEGALGSPLSDFEDAVLLEAARACGAQAVVTRNVRDFVAANLPVYEPAELLAILRDR